MMVDNHDSPMSPKTTQEVVRGWLWACVPETWVEWGVIVGIGLWLVAILMPANQSGPRHRSQRAMKSQHGLPEAGIESDIDAEVLRALASPKGQDEAGEF